MRKIGEISTPLNLEIIIKYASIFVSGSLFFLYLLLIDFSNLNSLFSLTIIANNPLLLLFFFLVFIFAIGSHIYLFGLRIYSKVFSKIFPEGMEDRDTAHIYWRHFSISVSFTILLLVSMEILYFAFLVSSLLGILLLILLISHTITYLLHNDIKIKKNKILDEKWKSFPWDKDSISKGYHSQVGLLVIINDFEKRVNDLSERV